MSNCSTCNRPFTCGMRESSEPCWCASMPALEGIDASADCLCPDCLRVRLDAEAAARPDVSGACKAVSA